MTDPLHDLLTARRRLAATMPEPTPRQQEALDNLDRAIARLGLALPVRGTTHSIGGTQ